MNHWLLDSLDRERRQALRQAGSAKIHKELTGEKTIENPEYLERVAAGLEMVILDFILDGIDHEDTDRTDFRSCAADAFSLLSLLDRPDSPVESGKFLLRASALAVLGDKGADAARWLRDYEWDPLPVESEDWAERTWATIIDVWLRLIRKQGWQDRDAVLERIAKLRDSQQFYEKEYLKSQSHEYKKCSALELICLYHLAKAAEVLAHYITDGVVDGQYQIHQLLDTHFDRVLAVCQDARMLQMEPMARLLAVCASQMADNSIWTVTRAVNSRVTQFVNTLVDRGRGDRAIFDVLPPQRRTLAERGLLGSSRRAVVVSLPTSSGKTLIAQFRILQALNQFEHERGWVAYLAPTRALVNQITRQLRKDFEPLGIAVEQVSPALEVDTIEADLLHQKDADHQFRVLVTTPEKLDLMLRQGLENEIERPLTLVVVDEAHNIQSLRRGLKLELLLATINNECQRAQFLLLTPFIKNAREIARWLGGTNSEDVSLALDWQPNDRVIGIIQAERGNLISSKSYDYNLKFETVHTSRETLVSEEVLNLHKNKEIASTFSKISNAITLAATAAQSLQTRGPIIVMHARPDWVWNLAEKLKTDSNTIVPTAKIELVQQFLIEELGEEFPLVNLLSHGIGVHHAGLPDDVRALMEWLFECNELNFLAATTTIAQGVNFPVSGVVMASHRYPMSHNPFWQDMPPEDFWNIAGRAGRISQGSLGVVALSAENPLKVSALKEFINRQVGDLNSTLIELAMQARDMLTDLKGIVYSHPEWSNFVQYLAHTYRQMGQPEGFSDQIEQILRGTLGFGKLRKINPELAKLLLLGIHSYSEYMSSPGQPLKLVDSTGFSLQSIRTVYASLGDEGIGSDSWDNTSLFSNESQELKGMMGVLLRVPELRDNLNAVTGGNLPDGNKLSLIIKDWVNGQSIPLIANRYFARGGEDEIKAITKCGQNLFGRLTQTTAWGLGALLSITGGNLSEEKLRTLRNLPSRVFYGVNSDESVTLRLLGVPRSAAPELAPAMGDILKEPLSQVRSKLRKTDRSFWQGALGGQRGEIYHRIWRVLEGLD